MDRLPNPAATRAAAEQLEARVLAMFDDIDAQIVRICGQMHTDGLPTRHYARTREGDRA